ncbi:MAG TPA: PilZ domain-containing protein [Bryobacteraceae bacterium]|nr:PilZ domain-containing protein [Bryobacteraceae bacterium]
MEQRRTRRFQLQLPLSITRTGAERVAFPGITKNISSTGVLFTTDQDADLSNSSIEYVITLNHEGPQMVNLRCVGKVVRCERDEAAYAESPLAYEVAATLERYEFVRER